MRNSILYYHIPFVPRHILQCTARVHANNRSRTRQVYIGSREVKLIAAICQSMNTFWSNTFFGQKKYLGSKIFDEAICKYKTNWSNKFHEKKFESENNRFQKIVFV